MTVQAPQQVWRQASIETGPMLTSEGDGLELLRKIRSKYYRQANLIVHRHTDPETGALPNKYHPIVEWYRTQGDRVNLLIPEDKEFLNVNLPEHTNPILLGTIAVVDEAGEVEHVPVEAQSADSQSVVEDVQGSTEGSVGYGTDYLGGSEQARLGEITIEEPGTGVSRTYPNPSDTGTSEPAAENSGTIEPVRD